MLKARTWYAQDRRVFAIENENLWVGTGEGMTPPMAADVVWRGIFWGVFAPSWRPPVSVEAAATEIMAMTCIFLANAGY